MDRSLPGQPRGSHAAARATVVRLAPDGAQQQPAWEKHEFVGLSFDVMSLDYAIEQVIARADLVRPFSYVTTPNVDHRVRLEREPALWEIYDRSWLTLCDSRILEILAKFDGTRLSAVPGADLVEHIVRTQIAPDEPVNIIGANAEIVESLRQEFGLVRVNWHEPPFGLRDNKEAIDQAAQFVVDHPARFTFLCVGSPQQEMVAHAIAERGGAVGVGLCCGASLGFLTGNVARAPKWMRSMALEWLHRLATEPTRMYRRYLIDGPAIFPIWMRERAHTHRVQPDPGAEGPESGSRPQGLEHAAE